MTDSSLAVAPSLVLTRLCNDARWTVGRVGMLYRDLVPDRHGGRVIASHIRIPEAGPVPDYVHYHLVRFQVIYCYAGWVRVVYEGQGPPFVMRAGDCVLQPPQIRHQVLECGTDTQVIEITSPAEHETCADQELGLPTAALETEREFSDQRFVFHDARTARWAPWRLDGFEARDSGIAAATKGLASVKVVRRSRPSTPEAQSHHAEFLFLFVLRGRVTLLCDARASERMAQGDCVVIPAKLRHGMTDASDDLELLEVALPASFETSA
jgi:mannose-6-phosphate isomerase-like protein (cupin superfamily)